MAGIEIAAFADEADSALSGQIAALHENGIRLLEIRGVDGKNVSALTAAEAREVRKRLDGGGIAVWSVGSPFGKIKLSEDFAPHLDSFCRILEIGNILGAKNLRVFSFYTDGPHASGVFDRVCERLDAFLQAAKGSGITLCHENEKGIFGAKAADCVRLHEAFPALRAVFDPANFVQCGEDPLAAYERLSPFVHYLHIKDCTADGTAVPAGSGIGQIPTLLQKFGQGVLTLEPHLAEFSGLSALENGERTRIDAHRYPTARAAFDAAAEALRTLL